MSLTLHPKPLPLSTGADGTMRIANTQITLDTIIYNSKSGASAEEISLRFPVAKLADIYAAITCYLRHQDEIGTHLHKRRVKRKQKPFSKELNSALTLAAFLKDF